MDVGADRGDDFGHDDLMLTFVPEEVHPAFPHPHVLVSSRIVASARDPAEGDIFTSESGNVLGKRLPGVGVEHNIVVTADHLIVLLKRLSHDRIKGVPKVLGGVGHIHGLMPGEFDVRPGDVDHHILRDIKRNTGRKDRKALTVYGGYGDGFNFSYSLARWAA